MKELDVANIAESILLQESDDIRNGRKGRPSTEVPTLQAEGPDYSNVKVSDNDVNKLLGVKPKEKIVESVVEPKKEVSQDRQTQVLNNLTKALQEAKELLREMTTCGSIGVNTAAKPKATKKKKKSLKDILDASKTATEN